jgi:hypothetical protein
MGKSGAAALSHPPPTKENKTSVAERSRGLVSVRLRICSH